MLSLVSPEQYQTQSSSKDEESPPVTQEHDAQQVPQDGPTQGNCTEINRPNTALPETSYSNSTWGENGALDPFLSLLTTDSPQNTLPFFQTVELRLTSDNVVEIESNPIPSYNTQMDQQEIIPGTPCPPAPPPLNPLVSRLLAGKMDNAQMEQAVRAVINLGIRFSPGGTGQPNDNSFHELFSELNSMDWPTFCVNIGHAFYCIGSSPSKHTGNVLEIPMDQPNTATATNVLPIQVNSTLPPGDIPQEPDFVRDPEFISVPQFPDTEPDGPPPKKRRVSMEEYIPDSEFLQRIASDISKLNLTRKGLQLFREVFSAADAQKCYINQLDPGKLNLIQGMLAVLLEKRVGVMDVTKDYMIDRLGKEDTPNLEDASWKAVRQSLISHISQVKRPVKKVAAKKLMPKRKLRKPPGANNTGEPVVVDITD